MATDPKKQDEIKDEELENVSGGEVDADSPVQKPPSDRPVRRVQDTD